MHRTMKEAGRGAVKTRDGERTRANVKVYTFPGEKRLAVTQAYGVPQVFGETERPLLRSQLSNGLPFCYPV